MMVNTREIVKFKELPFRYQSLVFSDEIMLYSHEDTIYAVSGFCPHFGGPLAIKDGLINCYWHDWNYDPKSHFCVNRKINLKIRSYKVKVIEQDAVEISYENKI